MADIPLFTGTAPKRSQSKSDFNKNIVSWLDYTTSLAPAINSVASEIVALSDIQAYSAVATYNYPDDVVRGSDGLTYQCVGTGVSGDNPVGSVTGNWVKVTLSESDIADYVTKKNLLLNGNFCSWHYGISQSSDGFGSDDHWYNGQSGSTCVHSQGVFVLGQTTVPNNPQYYSSSVVTSSSGPSNYVRKSQRIPNVLLLSGKTITINFYGKADSAKDICVEAVQNFGPTGSADVTAIDPQTITLSTDFVQKTVNIDIPSVSGKTLDGDGYTEINIWFDAGTDYNARTNSLGQQSGTFDISQIKAEIGSSFTGHYLCGKSVVELWSGSAGNGVTIDWSASSGYKLSDFDIVLFACEVPTQLSFNPVIPSIAISNGSAVIGLIASSDDYCRVSLQNIDDNSGEVSVANVGFAAGKVVAVLGIIKG